MADSFQDKTEQPTARRQQEARDEGRIPRTQELSAAVVLLAAGLAIGPAGARIVESIELAARASFTVGPSAIGTPAAAVDWMRWMGTALAVGFLPFAAIVGGVALLAGAGQARGTLAVKAIQPDWSRLSPAKNLKRFMSPRPLMDLLKALLKLMVVGAVVYVALSGALDELSRLPQSGVAALFSVLRAEITRVLLAAGLALLALAVADYGYQSWQYQRELRMTKDEVRRELKESEGDPLIRARLRSLGRSLTRMRMMSAVPTADVVVTNPTHIAVALRYAPEEADAPIVVAMGTRKLAERIKRIALESGVPVVENRMVARALFATSKVGRPIPPALYVAVAEILAFVFRHHRRTAAAGARA